MRGSKITHQIIRYRHENGKNPYYGETKVLSQEVQKDFMNRRLLNQINQGSVVIKRRIFPF